MAFRTLSFAALFAVLMAAPPTAAREVLQPVKGGVLLPKNTPAPTPAPTPSLRWAKAEVSTVTVAAPQTPSPAGPPPVVIRPIDARTDADLDDEEPERSVGAAEAVETPSSSVKAKNDRSKIRQPFGLDYDAATGTLFVADYSGHALYRVNPSTGAETVISQGASYTDGFNSMPRPYRIMRVREGPHAGDVILGSGISSKPMRIVNMQGGASQGNVTTLAGGAYGYREGTGRNARFRGVLNFAMLPGNETSVFVSDYGNHCIRHLDLRTGETSAFYGRCQYAGYLDAEGTSARMYYPMGMANGKEPEMLYVADRNNHIVRALNTTSKRATILIGRRGVSIRRDGPQGVGCVSSPRSLSRYGDVVYMTGGGTRELYVFSLSTKYLRHVLTASTGFVDGELSQARFARSEFVVAASESTVFLSDYSNQAVRRIDFTWEAGVDMSVPPSLFPSTSGAAGVAGVASVVLAAACALLL